MQLNIRKRRKIYSFISFVKLMELNNDDQDAAWHPRATTGNTRQT